MNVQQLADHIAKTWKCDESRYPELAGMSSEERRNFLVKHSILHITKTNGKLATVCEDFDHNKRMPEGGQAELEKATVKMFINALKLAEEVGLSVDTLLKKAPEYVK